jgi:hypothetical protein
MAKAQADKEKQAAPEPSNGARERDGGVSEIRGRIFLVGCPRSGTTLLQALLAAHPAIVSFPESHFFEVVSPRFATLGLISPKRHETRRLLQFLTDAGHPELEPLVPRHSVRVRAYIDAFIQILDTVALAQGKRIWLEKTPGHLHRIGMINRFVPSARVINILRNGPDVVASLYEVKHRYPDVWTGPRTIDHCIARWNRDLACSRRHVGQSNHLLVRYEELVQDPSGTVEALCRFVDVPFQPEMLEQYTSAAEVLLLQGEDWKRGATRDPIGPAAVRKFEQIFRPEEQRYILEHLDRPDF